VSETTVDSGYRQIANLTALQRELADLATSVRRENRPSPGRSVQIQGPVIVIRGK
jgi:hypothetical protein